MPKVMVAWTKEIEMEINIKIHLLVQQVVVNLCKWERREESWVSALSNWVDYSASHWKRNTEAG